MARTRIKMCGTTRPEDAGCAVDLGIDALGFIFVARSPRHVAREQARSIIRGLPPFITRVGVFVDASLDEIKECVEFCGLTQVQLHGKESPEFCRELKHWNRGCSICKAFRVGGKEAGDHVTDRIGLYYQVIDSILFDTYVKGIEGGTGASFDWQLVHGLNLELPLILAGGLTPENVAAAIKTAAPYAIDINSGVEEAPGRKDHQLLRLLVERVRAMERG